MLGRKTFTRPEVDRAAALASTQVVTFRAVADALPASAADQLAALEAATFADATLALDRAFVHRVRGATGKATTPLNELELLASALMADGTLDAGTVIRYDPAEAVLGLEPGTAVVLGVDDFERLSKAVIAELETNLLEP
jgi:hypothetical protein